MKKTSIYLGIIISMVVIYYFISPLFKNTFINENYPDNLKQTSNQSQVTGFKGHSATGTVQVVNVGEKRFLRYENFKTVNGPDLFIYLVKDLEAKEYIDLGVLKATEGNMNYEIPINVDIKEYKYAMTWCKKFSALFNYAELSNN